MPPYRFRPAALLPLLAFPALWAEVRAVPTPRGALSVDLRGAGARTLVFVHGNGAAKGQWEAQLARFARDHRVIAVDLPGMGASPRPARGGYSVAELSADLWAVLEALDARPVVLVAHSYGSAVALQLAGTHADAVEGVFLVDAAGDVRAPSEEARGRVKANLDPGRVDEERFRRIKDRMFEPILLEALPATRERVLKDLDGTDRIAFLGALAGLQDFDPAASLDRCRGPVMNLATDRMDPSATLHAKLPGVAATRLPGTSHWPMLDKPQAVNGALAGFLAGIHREQRQFDFWLGDWRVEDAQGVHLGDNRVTAALGGSVLQEHWRGSKGGLGTSLNAWIPAVKAWRQTWIDSQGGMLVLEGGWKEGAMVLEGEQPNPKGPVRSRISWTPLPDGRVRQVWEQSTIGGKAWAVAFDGYYRCKP